MSQKIRISLHVLVDLELFKEAHVK